MSLRSHAERGNEGWVAVLALILFACSSHAQQPQAELAPIDRDAISGVEDRTPVRNAEENYYEFQAYNYLLTHASKAPPEALAAKARRDLTLAHLFEESSKYRGEIVHLEGTLRRLRQFDAPKLAVKQGVKTLYEGWIYPNESSNDPYCVILTELPADVSPGEKLWTQVTYDGYFFKRYRYKAGDRTREAPLLIGRSLTALSAQGAGGSSPGMMANDLFLALFLMLIASAVLISGMAFWFRRGDRAVRGRLEAARTQARAEALACLEKAKKARINSIFLPCSCSSTIILSRVHRRKYGLFLAFSAKNAYFSGFPD